MQACAYEFPFAPTESEDYMATNESLSKEVSALAQRLAAVETELRIWGRIIGGAAGAGVLVGITALTWSIHIGNKVTAIEQQLADGGYTKLVAEIKAPKSPQQLQANLALVTAQVRKDRLANKKPDAQKVAALSDAVAQVIQKDPSVSEGWQAASQLINYRMPTVPAPLPACEIRRGDTIFMKPMIFPNLSSNQSALLFVGLTIENCTLTLDGPSPVFESKVFQDMLNHKGMIPALVLKNVHVIYRGGPLPGVRAIKFENCTFEFQANTAPPADASHLMQTILDSPTTSSVNFLDLPHAG
jgi:hypothetical protein